MDATSGLASYYKPAFKDTLHVFLSFLCLKSSSQSTQLWIAFTLCSVRDTAIDVEYPLIEAQLASIDQQLEKAISELNWTSEGIRFYTAYVIMMFTSQTERHVWGCMYRTV